jgi:gliding motility-associated-like protein
MKPHKKHLREYQNRSTAIFKKTFTYLFVFLLVVFTSKPTNAPYGQDYCSVTESFVEAISGSISVLRKISYDRILQLVMKERGGNNLLDEKIIADNYLNQPIKIYPDNWRNNSFRYYNEFENDQILVKNEKKLNCSKPQANFSVDDYKKIDLSSFIISAENLLDHKNIYCLQNIADTAKINQILDNDVVIVREESIKKLDVAEPDHLFASKVKTSANKSVILKNKKIAILPEKENVDNSNKAIAIIKDIDADESLIQNKKDNNFKNQIVKASVKNENSMTDTVNDELTLSNIVKINLPEIIVCCVADTIIDAGNASASFLWSTGEKTQKIRVNKTGSYSVTVSKGNIAAIDTSYVKVNNKPELNLPDYTIICHGEDISLNAGGGDYKYSWSTGASTTSIFVYERGVYYVDASNECGTIRDYSTVLISDSCSNSSYNIPEVFTPNSDGDNDCFNFKVKDVISSKTAIYNLSGIKIFESNDNIKYWDGKIGEKKASNGEYYYVIYAKTKSGDTEFRGKVRLKR